MELSNKEKIIIYDKEFLITKISIIEKIQKQFERIRRSIRSSIIDSNYIFPHEVDINTGKIFKGENYKLLPYVTLDYPKLFNKDDVFTFRTMFWWGNFFSSTLHISGEYYNRYIDSISKNIRNHLDLNIYVCVNDTPWEYHYDDDNYILLTPDNLSLINKSRFIKLSKKFEIEDYKILPTLVNEYFNNCLEILS